MNLNKAAIQAYIPEYSLHSNYFFDFQNVAADLACEFGETGMSYDSDLYDRTLIEILTKEATRRGLNHAHRETHEEMLGWFEDEVLGDGECLDTPEVTTKGVPLRNKQFLVRRPIHKLRRTVAERDAHRKSTIEAERIAQLERDPKVAILGLKKA